MSKFSPRERACWARDISRPARSRPRKTGHRGRSISITSQNAVRKELMERGDPGGVQSYRAGDAILDHIAWPLRAGCRHDVGVLG
jgi:hypothetical protein